MKLVLVTLSSVLLLVSSTGFSAGKKKAQKSPVWCCMVEGEAALAPKSKKKKMCVRSAGEPTATSKSKLTQSYVAACGEKQGTWEEYKKTAKK